MKAALGKKIGTTVLVIMMMVCCIPVIAGASATRDGRPGKGFDRPSHHRLALGIWRNPRVIEKLELTQDQVKQLRDLDFSHREKVLPLKAQIDAVHLKMDKAISDDDVDRKLVLTLAKKTADLKGKIFVSRMEAQLEFKEILTAEQINELELLFGPHRKHDRSPARSGFSNNPGFEKDKPESQEAF